MSLENHIIEGIIPAESPEYVPSAYDNGNNIPEFSLDASATPFASKNYKSAVSNILSKHYSEVKITSEDTFRSLTCISKKKLRGLITKHNNEIFAFMARPAKTPHMLGLAEAIFRKYGHEIPTIKGGNSNILKDLNLDISMCSATAFFNEGLQKIKDEGGLDSFMKQTRWMFNVYKTIGEEVLCLETQLFQKIEILDKLNTQIPTITTLESNEILPELIDVFSKYAETVYKSTQIENIYKELIETYKKWNICRQIIVVHNNFRIDTHDPMCSICLTDPVSTTIVPCGHTFCSSCVKKQNTTCYICRGIIRDRVKLFFT